MDQFYSLGPWDHVIWQSGLYVVEYPIYIYRDTVFNLSC